MHGPKNLRVPYHSYISFNNCFQKSFNLYEGIKSKELQIVTRDLRQTLNMCPRGHKERSTSYDTKEALYTVPDFDSGQFFWISQHQMKTAAAPSAAKQVNFEYDMCVWGGVSGVG